MPVAQVVGRVALQPRHVYVIPPNRQLAGDRPPSCDSPNLTSRAGSARRSTSFSVRSPAQHGDDFAIILSGAGSDGSVGIKAVKEAGGIILVQDPDEAEYGSMPRNAVATGLADFVSAGTRDRGTASGAGPRPAKSAVEAPRPRQMGKRCSAFFPICGSAQVTTSRATRNRRSAGASRAGCRCSAPRRWPIISWYLRENPGEAPALFADLLISVTTFFRDPNAFEKLAALVIPRLFEEKGAPAPIRVWVAGCATGEEAYSIAILLLEEASRQEIRCEIQVFASDLDDGALSLAREGRYPAAIEADMTEERLRKLLHPGRRPISCHARIAGHVVLFAKHSLLKDPPFSRVDLVSCRNVLIYLDREVQQHVCATFHFALHLSGYLFLGSSESADGPVGAFRPIDRESRIYQRASIPAEVRVTPRSGAVTFGLEPPAAANVGPVSPAGRGRGSSRSVGTLGASEHHCRRVLPGGASVRARRAIPATVRLGR